MSQLLWIPVICYGIAGLTLLTLYLLMRHDNNVRNLKTPKLDSWTTASVAVLAIIDMLCWLKGVTITLTHVGHTLVFTPAAPLLLLAVLLFCILCCTSTLRAEYNLNRYGH